MSWPPSSVPSLGRSAAAPGAALPRPAAAGGGSPRRSPERSTAAHAAVAVATAAGAASYRPATAAAATSFDGLLPPPSVPPPASAYTHKLAEGVGKYGGIDAAFGPQGAAGGEQGGAPSAYYSAASAAAAAQLARDSFRRSEAERELLAAEHDVLRSQLSETRRMLGTRSPLAPPAAAAAAQLPAAATSTVAPSDLSQLPPPSLAPPPQAADAAAAEPPAPRRACNFFTAVPSDNELLDGPTAVGQESELEAIHFALCGVEAKLTALATPVQKAMKYRPVTAGTRVDLTSEDEVVVHAPVVSEAVLAEEQTLLGRWRELRADFDAKQAEIDARSNPAVPVEQDATARVSGALMGALRSAGWYSFLVGVIAFFLVIILNYDLDAAVLQVWVASFIGGVLWCFGVLRRKIPLWASLAASALTCVVSILLIMMYEEDVEGSGAPLALPLLITASVVAVVALTERDTPLLFEVTETDQTASDEVFRAVLSGNLAVLQREAQANPWKLRRRDKLTATPLLCALLRAGSSRKHATIAHWLVTFLPHLSLDVYTENLFRGVCGHHFTVLHRDTSLTHRMAHTAPHCLAQRATGSFFNSADAFFGETPLMFAVTTNQPDVLAFFLKFTAERLRVTEREQLSARDSKRNTLLHLCVFHNLPKMYDYVEYLMEEYGATFKDDDGNECLFNADNLTPFTLSAELGYEKIFCHLVDKATDEVWRLGSTRCRKMWLDEVDPIHKTIVAPPPKQLQAASSALSAAGSDKTNGDDAASEVSTKKQDHIKGVLEILVDNEHVDLLFQPSVRELLLVKWSTYVERIWLCNFALLMVYVIAFSIVAFYGPMARSQNSTQACSQDSWFTSDDSFVTGLFWTAWCDMTAYPLQRISELVVVCGAVYRTLVECKQAMVLPTSIYFGRKGSMLLEQISVYFFCMCVYTAVFFRIVGNIVYEDLALALAALALWSYVLHELLGFEGTGPFVVMIWKMLGSDLLRFFIIFATFLIGFTQALYLLVNKYGAQYFFRRLMGCFVALLGQADITALIIEEDSSHFPTLSTFLLVVYVLMVSILLLNLLIAMMTTTYSKIYDESDKVWNLEWARIVLATDHSLTFEEKNSPEYRYWGEQQTPGGGVKRYFLLPSSRDDDREEFTSVPPSWPRHAPQTLSS